MYRTTIHFLAGILLACAAGCQSAARLESFSHQQRIDYAMSDAEFEDLHFFISEKVFVRAIGGAPEFDKSGSGVIIAPRGTEGRVVAVGPDWLRVRFGLGEGAYFKTDTSRDYDRYWLATQVGGTDGLVKLKDRDDDEQILVLEGITYDVVYGRTAFLRVDRDS